MSSRTAHNKAAVGYCADLRRTGCRIPSFVAYHSEWIFALLYCSTFWLVVAADTRCPNK